MILLFELMLAGYAFGAAAAVLAPAGGAARGLVATGAVGGGGAGLGLGLTVFFTGAPFGPQVPALLSVADGLVVRLDALGAFFLGLVDLVAIPCAIYGVAYSQAYEGRHSPARRDAEPVIVPWFERYLYAPLIARPRRLGLRARAIQSGSAHAYLAYLVIALVGLLALLLVREM